MINKLDDDIIFINSSDLFPILSPTFLDRKAEGIICLFNSNNDFSLKFEDNITMLGEKIYDSMNHDPDGYILFISNDYVETFIKFCQNHIIQSYKNNQLNFDNGGVSEIILFHSISNGIIVELIDPECLSVFFKELIKEFQKIYSPTDKEFINVELNHMFSSIQDLEEKINGKILLDILINHKFNYYSIEGN